MVKTLILQFEENDRRIFWAFAALLGMLAGAYIYFLSISVYAVVDRKSAERNISDITAQISSLETQYVSYDRRIDPSLAYARGFIDVSVPKYITRDTGKNTTLTLRDERGTY